MLQVADLGLQLLALVEEQPELLLDVAQLRVLVAQRGQLLRDDGRVGLEAGAQRGGGGGAGGGAGCGLRQVVGGRGLLRLLRLWLRLVLRLLLRLRGRGRGVDSGGRLALTVRAGWRVGCVLVTLAAR